MTLKITLSQKGEAEFGGGLVRCDKGNRFYSGRIVHNPEVMSEGDRMQTTCEIGDRLYTSSTALLNIFQCAWHNLPQRLHIPGGTRCVLR